MCIDYSNILKTFTSTTQYHPWPNLNNILFYQHRNENKIRHLLREN